MLDWAKAALAASGTAFLGWLWLRGSATGAASPRRAPAAVLAGLGVAGGLLWWNLLFFHPTGGFLEGYLHVHELFHYYLGAKYFRELGYEGLYPASLTADLDAGAVGSLDDRAIRNLATNHILPGSVVVGDPARWRARFSEERWSEFRHDVDWFRAHMPPAQWRQVHLDHGYNATPVWTLAGSLLANTAPASRAQMLALALIDPLLLLGMWACAAWAFGWPAACVAALFWGTNAFAQFGWTGGAFLRQDWLFATVAGIACLRRERPLLAGGLLAWAALLRIFPAVPIAAVAAGAALEMLRRRSLRPDGWALRLAGGSLATALLLLPAASLATGGPGAWADFAANSRLHLGTPFDNSVGLTALLAFDPDATLHELRRAARRGRLEGDPAEAWKQARRESLEAERGIQWAACAVFAGLLLLAIRGRPPWQAAVLGVGAIPFATSLSCYYLALLLVYGFLWPVRPGIGVALCGLAAASWGLAWGWAYPDERYVRVSLAVIALVVLATAAMVPRRGRAGAAGGPDRGRSLGSQGP